MNVKEFITRNQRMLLIGAGIAVVAVAIAIVASRDSSNPCAAYDDLNGPILTGAHLNTEPTTASGNGTLKYNVSGWCGIPNSEEHCGCKLELNELLFEYVSSNTSWNGIPVDAVLVINDGINTTTKTISFNLGGTVDVANEQLTIYEGTTISITPQAAGTSLPSGLRLRCGGLCVIDEVEGGDNRFIRAGTFGN